MTYVVSARLPFALVHTIGERRVVLVVPVELEHEVQNDFVQALGIEIDPTPPWMHKNGSLFWPLKENKTARSQRFDQMHTCETETEKTNPHVRHDRSIQQDN